MKLNKWTAALAAAGVVTVPSLLHAQTNSILTALSTTTLSGYVDTSAQWNIGTGNANNPPYSFGGRSKADGFNLDVVDLALDKPLDDSLWAAGYHVELWMGPDANLLFSQSSGNAADFAVRQAYVALRTPVGNGITWKLGVFDTIIGYEGLTSPNNPNFTRSYGFSIEPTTHTGLLGTYQVNDELSLSAGIADTFGPTINGRAPIESFKTYMGSATYTVSTNAGWLSGSTVSAGVINGFNGAVDKRQTSVYAGTTFPTPITALKFGVALDYNRIHHDQLPPPIRGNGNIWVLGLYSSYQATEKLAFNLRGEYVASKSDLQGLTGAPNANVDNNGIWELTATAQYDLWKNVLSRVELRWDHVEHGKAFGGNDLPTCDSAYLLAANIIYKF
jgi:hypothetical protein